MDENRNRREEALNDAALENVSGGVGGYFVDLARQICLKCLLHDGPERCSASPAYSLGDYLKEHGVDSVNAGNYQAKCPYYRK